MGLRDHSRPHHHTRPLELEPRPRHDLHDATAFALEPLQVVAAVDIDPVLLEYVLEEATDLRPELTLERHLLLHHHRAVVPARRKGRGNLAGDEAAADEHHALALPGIGQDGVGVRVRPQVVEAVQVPALGMQPPHVRAGREQRLVEADLVPVRQRRPALPGIQLHHARARQDLDLVLRPLLGRLDVLLLAARLACQILLRQRGAVVRRVRLAAGHQDRPVGALLAERPRAVAARHPATDHEEVDVALGHASY